MCLQQQKNNSVFNNKSRQARRTRYPLLEVKFLQEIPRSIDYGELSSTIVGCTEEIFELEAAQIGAPFSLNRFIAMESGGGFLNNISAC